MPAHILLAPSQRYYMRAVHMQYNLLALTCRNWLMYCSLSRSFDPKSTAYHCGAKSSRVGGR